MRRNSYWDQNYDIIVRFGDQDFLKLSNNLAIRGHSQVFFLLYRSNVAFPINLI